VKRSSLLLLIGLVLAGCQGGGVGDAEVQKDFSAAAPEQQQQAKTLSEGLNRPGGN
jgi:hypothetical protein